MNLAQEIWIDVPGYENIYQVSNSGKVKSLTRKIRNGKNSYYTLQEKILNPYVDKKGYVRVNLRKNNNNNIIELHKIVFFSFNPISKKTGYEINHKDGNKVNNSLDNLEYITHKENMEHAKKYNLIKYNVDILRNNNEIKKIKVNQFDLNYNFITTYESINDARRQTGINTINKVFSNGNKPLYKTAGGFIWEKE